MPDFLTPPTVGGTGVALAGHGHANATTSAAGFESAADKAKLNALSTVFRTWETFSTFDQTFTANTWTKLNNAGVDTPKVLLPILGAPPTGFRWLVQVIGSFYFVTAGAGSVLVGTRLDDATNTPVHGGAYSAGGGTPAVLNAFFRLDPLVSHTFTFLYNGPGGSTRVFPASPEALAFLEKA